MGENDEDHKEWLDKNVPDWQQRDAAEIDSLRAGMRIMRAARETMTRSEEDKP